MVNTKLLAAIQKDIDVFDSISQNQQLKLVNVLINQWIIFTDLLFEKLAKEKDIEEIVKNIDFLVPFLLRMWNFLLNENTNFDLNKLLELLKTKNSYTNENMIKLFWNESDFIKSIECEMISNKIVDNIDNYESNNSISELKYWEFSINSKISIKSKNKNIELILGHEQLVSLKQNIERNIEMLDLFKERIKEQKIKIFK